MTRLSLVKYPGQATLRKVLGQTVTVREGEVVRRVTRLEAVLLSLIARALKGDAKATATVLELSRLVEQDEAPEPLAPPADGAKQELASRLDKIAARLAAAQAAEDGTVGADPGSAGPGSAEGYAEARGYAETRASAGLPAIATG